MDVRFGSLTPMNPAPLASVADALAMSDEAHRDGQGYHDGGRCELWLAGAPLPLDPGDWLDDDDRAALHRALEASEQDVQPGDLYDADEVLAELRAR